MKRVVFFVLLLSLVFGTISARAESIDIKTDNVSKGYVSVLFNTGSTKKIKLMVSKGNAKYYYNLKNSSEYVNFPLQLGDGNYTINVYENTSGTKYKKLRGTNVNVIITDKNAVFVNPIQEVNFKKDDAVMKHVDQLIKVANDNKVASGKGGLTEHEKVNILYDYIVKNIKYDYDKAKNLSYDYLPDNVTTLKTKYGICYDYSSFMGAMLRSQGIPTKLVKGYTSWTKVYHAWNEIYLSDEKRWIIVDTTYDSYMYLKNGKYDFEKSSKVYSKSKEY